LTSPRPFFDQRVVRSCSWQALERLVVRYAIARGFQNVRQVGGSGDGGADVVGTFPSSTGGRGVTWLFQAKHHRNPVGAKVLDETVDALAKYRATKPVIICTGGFDGTALRRKIELANSETRVNFELWTSEDFERLGSFLSEDPPFWSSGRTLKGYQEKAITEIVARYKKRTTWNALVVLATGLGKTLTAAEAIRRIRHVAKRPIRTLVLAHTTDLIRQLERGFWPLMGPSESTCIVDGEDRPDSLEQLANYTTVFATRQSVHGALETRTFPSHLFDVVLVDECHHLGSPQYERILDELSAGKQDGPFLIGLSATPWRPDGTSLDHRFDDPVIEVGLHEGLRMGYLSKVDYRMLTDDIDWDALRALEGANYSATQVNRTLFLPERDDAVVEKIAEAWAELEEPKRGLVFCGTIKHAESISRKINELGFTRADTILSKVDGRDIKAYEKSRKLMDFDDGTIGVLCSVDVLNEGIDTPSVNLVVFQRQTHSRRIFVQQLGRGLRISRDKTKVLVLDFVSDIKRLAEAAHLKDEIELGQSPRVGHPVTLTTGNRVSFQRAGREDLDTTRFLSEWLEDMDEVARHEGDKSILQFPRFDF